MSIKRYNAKRDFKLTPEPAGATAKSRAKGLLFVVQKHAASHLHYDFRLELEGVMKSWAVPKGPSLNPAEKRLAMHVEDHPMAYRIFEGIIPKGNYGAGTVMVWDEGTYYADASLSKKANEKILLDGYHKGKLSFHLQGEKLHGEFSLVRMRGKSTEDNAWLLFKADDATADSDNDIRDQDHSAVSGRSMSEIADNTEVKVWISKPGHAKGYEDPTRKVSKSAQDKTTGNVRPSSSKTGSVKTSKTAKAKNSKVHPDAADGVEDGTRKTIDGSKSPGTRRKKFPDMARAALKLGGEKTAVPTISGPQLATLVDAPFDREGWIFEIKWDGYRALGFNPAHDGVSLISRNGHSFDDRFPGIRAALLTLPCTAIVDGEVVALDEDGKPSFGQLQNSTDQDANRVYYLFDLLYVDGVDVRAVSLLGRKQLLQQLLAGCDVQLQYSDHVATSGIAFFEAARQGKLEGIVAKDAAAAYQTGRRTRHWLKVKIAQRQEFVIAGYTQPRRSRSDIGSLVLAYYGTSGKTAGKLRFAGHVGSGMDTRMRAELKQKLDRLVLQKSPFAEPPSTNEVPTWVKPTLVCEVRYTEKTADCQLRHPVFVGLRSDKPADAIHWDVAQDTELVVEAVEQNAPAARKHSPGKKVGAQKKSARVAAKTTVPKATAIIAEMANIGGSVKTSRTASSKANSSLTNSKKTTSNKTDSNKANSIKTTSSKPTPSKTTSSKTTSPVAKASDGVEKIFSKEAPERDKLILKINGKSVAISHPRRIYYPELKLSKMDVIDFYRTIAPYLLPYLKDRPFVLHRFPGGIYHEGFYQKDNEQELPEWVKSIELHSESTDADINYLVCQNEATLVYLANLGCLEMNPWNSRIRHIDKPDWMIFDLDPVDISFTKVVEVAQVIHGMFEASGIPHYCKTSGKRGLHIAVPLGAKYTNDTVREMAESIAQLVHQEMPGSTSLERSPAKRQKKIYLDYLQNGTGKTLAAPYSLRPVDYAGVSTPLHWDEVSAKLDPRDFNIHTILDRLQSEGDLWQGMLTETIDLKALLR